MITEIPEDDFERDYQPIHFEWHDAIHGDVPVEHVWTIVSGDDDNLYAAAGFHLVNRISYCVTNKPWQEDFEVAEWMMSEKHEEIDA